jgi:ADP-heptose:LPS heptosyltransferase
MKKKKILIIKLLGIGDLVMTLPTYYFLCEKYGKENVFWLVDSKMINFLSIFLSKENIYTCDYSQAFNGKLNLLKLLISINYLCIKSQFDKIYILHGHFYYKFLAILKVFSTYHASSTKFVGRKYLIGGRYLGLNHYNFVSNQDGPSSKFEIYYNFSAEIFRSKLLESHYQFPSSDYVVLCPGSNSNPGDDTSLRRQISLKNWELISKGLISRGHKVVILGSSKEKDNYLSHFHNGEILVTDLTEFNDIGLLLQKSKVVISTDN